jgi:hypothetical protein
MNSAKNLMPAELMKSVGEFKQGLQPMVDGVSQMAGKFPNPLAGGIPDFAGGLPDISGVLSALPTGLPPLPDLSGALAGLPTGFPPIPDLSGALAGIPTALPAGFQNVINGLPALPDFKGAIAGIPTGMPQINELASQAKNFASNLNVQNLTLAGFAGKLPENLKVDSILKSGVLERANLTSLFKMFG